MNVYLDESLLSIVLCLLICLFGHSLIQALRTQRWTEPGPLPGSVGRGGEPAKEGVLAILGSEPETDNRSEDWAPSSWMDVGS